MNAMPGSPITTYFRVCDGVRVRFADTNADSDTTVLLLAPWPESVWAFRRIWHQLTALGRIVAIEMPGFGHSDQSRPELIAPDASGDFLARLIDEWGLGSPHVVGPDVGTAAALFLAARTPERVTSLTVGGGAVRFPIDAGGALKDVIEAPSLDVVRALDARTNIGYAVEAGAASHTEPEVHEDYVSAYDLGRFAESARFVRHYPELNPVLRELLPTITTPTQIVAGRNDDLVPWSNNEYLNELVPNNEIHALDAGTWLGSRRRRNMAAWLWTGLTAGTCVPELRRCLDLRRGASSPADAARNSAGAPLRRRDAAARSRNRTPRDRRPLRPPSISVDTRGGGNFG
jgi:pimeloyl-ACP methyl ester carboxylesterase